MRKLVVVLALACAPSLFAQTVTIGAFPPQGALEFSSSPATYVDLTHPATASGAISSVMVRWFISGGGTCSNAFKVKFIHPNLNGTAFSVTERGPFNATLGDVTVQISPTVSVSAGDYIGITVLQPFNTCGGVTFTTTDPSQRFWRQTADLGATGDFSNGTFSHGVTLAALGRSGTEYLAGVVTAAGATQGVGAFFRTAMQLTNSDAFSNAIGRLVYHAQGRPAATNDPSLQFNVPPLGTLSYSDVVTQMGLSGLGSMDVMMTQGPLPAITTRVFSDNGPAGTLGFTEDTIAPELAVSAPQYATLTLPADLTNFRMNIGVRSLSDGATIAATYIDAGGHEIGFPPTKVYQPNYFEQVTVSDFVGTTTLAPNGSIQIYVTAGSAIVYASTTDNRTSDSSIKFAGR
ncbi:MAG TPA: hypothetical protein VGR95_01745 [Thermoanaerobaculia bacterium]|nr:hypothetical protein [Thermoanaerobaculia bacterium]